MGWHWALALSQRHDVLVVTHPRFQPLIEAALAACPQLGLAFSYHRVPGVQGDAQQQVDSRLYYWRWQRSVRAHVAALLAQQPQDLLHHLTWGSYRLPCRLHGLGPPLVVGPVGGGDDAPAAMRRGWPWRERLFYGLRSASIALSRFDPAVHTMLSAATCVLTKTPATRAALPRAVQWRAVDALELGIGAAALRAAPAARPAQRSGPLRLLYAGRLLGGKGAVYAVDTAIELHRRGVDMRLTLAGSGRLQSWLQQRVAAAGAQAVVHFAGVLPHADMPALYDAHDLLLFASWHDSSGNVAAEALARGLPVLCLDTGGPRAVVGPAAAAVVPLAGLGAAGLVQAMADRAAALAACPQDLHELSVAALARAAELTWDAQVAHAYAHIESRLGWPAAVDPKVQS